MSFMRCHFKTLYCQQKIMILINSSQALFGSLKPLRLRDFPYNFDSTGSFGGRFIVDIISHNSFMQSTDRSWMGGDNL